VAFLVNVIFFFLIGLIFFPDWPQFRGPSGQGVSDEHNLPLTWSEIEHTAHFFFDGVLKGTGAYQPLLWACVVLLIKWVLLLFLYRKRIFLRV
jgi:hypothetical protein